MIRSKLAGAFCTMMLTAAASGQTSIQLDGVWLGSPQFASGGGTLTGTSQGRIMVTAETGSWTLIVADVAIADVMPSSPEFALWSTLVSRYPWLVRRESTVAEELLLSTSASYLGDLVEPADLAMAASTPLLVRSADVRELVMGCVDPQTSDPEAVRSYAQPMLAGQTVSSWKTATSLWSSSPMGLYWIRTYARPLNPKVEIFEQIDWTRLMESAALGQTTLDDWLDFTRSGDVYDAASLGLHVHVQAVSLKGNSTTPPTADPATTPGLEGVTPTALARFKISQPVTIAIPFTPPFLPGLMIPYAPGVLNPDQKEGTLIAAIGRVTSATHAVFPGMDVGVLSKLVRFPDPEGPIAMFEVPIGASPGLVSFVDLDGVDESMLIPIDPFPWMVSGN